MPLLPLLMLMLLVVLLLLLVCREDALQCWRVWSLV
jgi:hypothetical protein